MKKMMWVAALAMATATAAFAQESRQEVSLSGFVPIAPDVHGNGVNPLHMTLTTGILASYRYDLTPRSQLELNYTFAQNSSRYNTSSINTAVIHTRQQELSGAYVYTRAYGNFNPFLEAGVGAIVFSPIRDNGTNELDTKRNVNIGGLFGGGVAYEISPSFDVRLGYRGFLVKAPGFGRTEFSSNRYFVISEPTLGVAYHF